MVQAAKKKSPEPVKLHRYISVGQLAELLGMSPRTIYNWNSAQTGPPYTYIGGRVRYTEEAVASWLAAQEVGQIA